MKIVPERHVRRMFLVVVTFRETGRHRESGAFTSERDAKAFGRLYNDDYYKVSMSKYVRAKWVARRKATQAPGKERP